jgi:Na+/H+ antiporter NhaD/arsenite permease-like protein
MTVAVVVFACALGLIISERYDRAVISLLGAALILLTGTSGPQEAIAAVDAQTIGLLAGMMVIVAITEDTGVYKWLAIRIAQASRGHPAIIVPAIGITTALLSAFLDNVTTVLLLVPVSFQLADALEVDPVPLVIIEIIASNIGGTATLIGDPPNILIAGHTDLTFGAFITNLAPIVAITGAVISLGLYLLLRSQLQVMPKARAQLMQLDAADAISGARRAKRTIPVLLATIAAFFLHGRLGLQPASIALMGAVLILLISRSRPHEAFSAIQWRTLFFLAGLFIMVGALEQNGALQEVANGMSSLSDGNRQAELFGILWTAAVGSALVDNIPFTAAMLPVVDQLGGTHDAAYWWALSLGACFGGNALLISAAANVAAAGAAEKLGQPIGFLRYMRYGLPATLVSMLMASGYIMLRYL